MENRDASVDARQLVCLHVLCAENASRESRRIVHTRLMTMKVKAHL